MIYLNNKTGKRYRVRGFGTDCTNSRNGTDVAIYSPEDNDQQLFVRDLAEFDAKFTRDLCAEELEPVCRQYPLENETQARLSLTHETQITESEGGELE